MAMNGLLAAFLVELCRLLGGQPLGKVGVQEFPDADSNDSMGGRNRPGPKERLNRGANP